MKILVLPTQEYLFECFSYDTGTGLLYWKKRPRHHYKHDGYHKLQNRKYAGHQVGLIKHDGLQLNLDGKIYFVHRIIYKLCTSNDPPRLIDHIDGDPFNNKIENLRPVNESENSFNQKLKSNNTSCLKGVYWNRQCQKYAAKVEAYGKRYYLGMFDNKDLAHKAYCEKAKELHGEYFNAGN